MPHPIPDLDLDPLAAITSDDPAQVKAALQNFTSRLEGRIPNDLDHDLIGLTITPLTNHPDTQIREALAAISALLPKSYAEHILERLAGDSDHYVRQAAYRATKQRALRQKQRRKREELADASTRFLDEIEESYGRKARALAAKASSVRVAQIHHELAKVAVPIEASLAHLGNVLSADSPDIARASAHFESLRERFRFLSALLGASRDAFVRPEEVFERAPLLPVTEAASTQLMARAGERAERIAMSLDVPLTLELDYDRRSLLQALQNLLQNAIEASRPEGPICISITARLEGNGTRVTIVIADNGEGMTEAEQERLFTPFKSQKPGGTGIGLSVVRREIEEGHGGDLQIASTKGEGTTVTLTLPAFSNNVRRAGQAERGEQTNGRGSAKRIRKPSPKRSSSVD